MSLPTQDQVFEVRNIIQDVDDVFRFVITEGQIMNRYIDSEDEEAHGFWIRTAIRNVFAEWEARLYQLRRVCLAYQSIGVISFTHAEILGLEDCSFRVNDQGQVVKREAKTATAASFRFVFSMLANACGVANPLDTSGSDWTDFQTIIKVRNRLTHPKTTSCFDISNDEAAAFGRSVKWMNSIFDAMARQASAEINSRLKDLGEKLS